MIPVVFDRANAVLEGPTAPPIADLAVFQGEQDTGLPIVISCWRFSNQELDEIMRTGRVWLLAQGTTHLPVKLSGHDPFIEDPEPTKATPRFERVMERACAIVFDQDAELHNIFVDSGSEAMIERAIERAENEVAR